MPSIDDYSEEEDDKGGGAGGGMSGGSGGGGGTSGALLPGAQREKQFVGWDRIAGANKDVAAREANKLQSGVAAQGKAATDAIGAAGDAQREEINKNYSGYSAPNTSGEKGFAQSSFAALGGQPGSFNQQTPADSGLERTSNTPTPRANAQDGGIVDNGRLQTDLSTLDPAHGQASTTTANSALTGAKDLESSMGADAWGKLTGQVGAAADAANALGGGTSSVQALLHKNNGAGTEQDAALLGGAGTGFGDVAKQYGGDALNNTLRWANEGAQNRWNTLAGDVGNASAGVDQSILDANKNIDKNAKPDATPATPAAPQDTGSGWHPEGTTDLNSFLTGGTARDDISAIGMGLSPLDQIWQNIPGMGNTSISQLGANYFVGGGAGHPENITRQALGAVAASYGQDAAEYLWNHMTPEMWKAYLSENLVDQRSNMEAWLESAGFKRKSPEARTATTNGDGSRQVSGTAPGGSKTPDERIADYDENDPGWNHNSDGRRTTTKPVAKKSTQEIADENDPGYNHTADGRRAGKK